jgi:hypothetical protein
MALRKLQVDMEGLLDAMESYGDDPRWFFNRETGRVAISFDATGFDTEPVFDREDPSWVEVPRSEAHEEHRAMERFAADLDDEDVRELLVVALAGRGSFSRFRGVLYRHPDLRQRWEEEKRQRVLAKAMEWLADLGIEPVYELRATPPPASPPPPRSEPHVVGLLDLLLLGAPGGKTELIEGRVRREFLAANPAQARATFARIARELTEFEGVAWRKHFITGRDEYVVGASRLAVAGQVVQLEVEVSRATRDAFTGRDRG